MSAEPPRCVVVICDYDGWAQTRRCLAALYASSYQEFDTILVDHGTSTETRDGLCREFPQVERIEGASTLWWSGATNVGLRAALARGAARVILLNNDCYVEADTLAQLECHARDHPTAIIAPVQRDAQTGEVLYVSPRDCLLFGFITMAGPKSISAEQRNAGLIRVRLINGGRGALIPATVLTQVGLLDEQNLPHYWADHDFYLRCRASGVQMYAAVDVEVQVDRTRSSIAADAHREGWRAFVASLSSPRSHRNLAAQRALFRKHYPVHGLHNLGIAMYLLRYVGVYFLRRVHWLWRHKRDGAPARKQ